VAARDVHAKDWSYETHGDPFYDPENEEGGPPPEGCFATWDEDLEADDPMLNRPSSVVASASVYSEAPARTLLRSYKLCRVNPLVSDLVRATTEADIEMQKQVNRGAPTL
jgi:hypothetical protein